MEQLKYIFFGVRGSYPVSDGKFIGYGGNTTSLLIENGDKLFLIDAGSGIIRAGEYLKKRKKIKKLDIYLTHLHIDHIMGLPFFSLFYMNECEITLHCFRSKDFNLKDTVYSLFMPPLSPISPKGIPAKIRFKDFNPYKNRGAEISENLKLEWIKDETHPKSGVLIYRVVFFDKKLVFATDIETPNGLEKRYIEFIKDADVLIHDAQYTNQDYFEKGNEKVGYGHSTIDMALTNARECRVKKLILFHHNPSYNDSKLEKLLENAKKRFNNTYLAKELKINILRR